MGEERTPSTNIWRQRLLWAGGILLLGLLLVVASLRIWLSTPAGRNYVVQQIEQMEFENGLKIRIGRIDGSLFNTMQIHQLALHDPQGPFLEAPEAVLDWQPWPLLWGKVDIRAVLADDIHWARMPQFAPTPPDDGPLLPDMAIDLHWLEIKRLHFGPELLSVEQDKAAQMVSLTGSGHLANRSVRFQLDGRALDDQGVAGDDRLNIKLDATPEQNRLKIALGLSGPADGVIAGLAGLDDSFALSLSGNGDWQSWDGRLHGQLGEDNLADIALSARDGDFAAKGSARPGLLFDNGMGRLFEPETAIELKASLQDQEMKFDGGLHNAHFRLVVDGGLNHDEGVWRGLGLRLHVAKPELLAEGLRADGLALEAELNGPLAAPHILSKAHARHIAWGELQLNNPALTSQIAPDDAGWRVGLGGRATGVAGLGEMVAPVLADLRLEGDILLSTTGWQAEHLRLRSAQMDATASLASDWANAQLHGQLTGRIDRFLVQGLGLFSFSADAGVASEADGAPALSGRVMARTIRLDNSGVEGFLGGAALIAADIAYGGNGVATMRRLNVSSPDFRLWAGEGAYHPDGAFRFAAKGDSRSYGPLALQAKGTFASPVLEVQAARPGMGIGLADVRAVVRAVPAGWQIEALGSSDYGPARANIGVATATEPMRIAIQPGTELAGIGLTGEVEQLAEGPFAGTLDAQGSGITGALVLSGHGKDQQARFSATARNASLPGDMGLSVSRGSVEADFLLGETSRLTGEMEFAGLRAGGMQISRARADIDYADGQGQARMMAEGRRQYPFRMALNAQLQPDLWRVAVQGRMNDVPVKTVQPMLIVPEKDRYVFHPARFEIGKGNLQLAGHYGHGFAWKAGFHDADMALLAPFFPGLGLGGRMTGVLDIAQARPGAMPDMQARMRVADFTRTGLGAVSRPLAIEVQAELNKASGHIFALARQQKAIIARLQLRMQPGASGMADWIESLMNAPISGGLRYNGPADTLFSLAALPDQKMQGAMGVAADFGGNVAAPQLAGLIRGRNLAYENTRFGTRLTKMVLEGRFVNDRLLIEKMDADAGEGHVTGVGFVSFSAEQGIVAQLDFDMASAQLANSGDISAKVSGPLSISRQNREPLTISARLQLPETHYRIVRKDAAELPMLSGIRRKSGRARRLAADDEDEDELVRVLAQDWRLDVGVQARNQIFVTGMGLDSEWSADLRVKGTTGTPQVSGQIDLVRGTLGFAGRSFILREGKLRFAGGAFTDPQLHIVAEGDVEDVAMRLTVTGSGEKPQIAFSSVPALPQDELMARILFGRSVADLSAIQAVQLAASLNSLRGGGGGGNPLSVLQSSTGIDRLRILGADEAEGRGTSLAVGQYITKRIYVEVISDARGHTATQLEITLTRALSILSEMSNFGRSAASLRYRKDY